MTRYLAQLNIARMRAPLDHPVMKEFVDFLAPVNALADDSPGFVWRLKDENGVSSAYVDPAFGDDAIITNLTVWRDIEALRTFTYRTVHGYFVRNRERWFEAIDTPSLVLWWIEEGHIPTLDEARARLELLSRRGATAEAFTLGTPFDSRGRRLEKRVRKHP